MEGVWNRLFRVLENIPGMTISILLKSHILRYTNLIFKQCHFWFFYVSPTSLATCVPQVWKCWFKVTFVCTIWVEIGTMRFGGITSGADIIYIKYPWLCSVISRCISYWNASLVFGFLLFGILCDFSEVLVSPEFIVGTKSGTN